MADIHQEATEQAWPTGLIGTWRRFGSAGPVYEILDSGGQPGDGDRLMRIRVVESGEELDYRITEILDDPIEN